MRKQKYDNQQQYFIEHKNLALQRLNDRSTDKNYVGFISKPLSPPTKLNESFKASPKGVIHKPLTTYVMNSKLKINTASSSNMSSEEAPINSVNSEQDERRQSPTVTLINNIYGLSNRSNTTKKPNLSANTQEIIKIQSSRPLNPKVSQTVLASKKSDSKEHSIDSSKQIQTSYIDLKQPIANLTKEENDIYLQVIKMRQNTGRGNKLCAVHPQHEVLIVNYQEINFSNLERTAEYCQLCAIEKAYQGLPLIYLPTQQILTPNFQQKSSFVRSNDIVWNVDLLCQQQGVLQIITHEQQQKKTELQHFMTYLQKTHDHLVVLINEYAQYQMSADVESTNKQARDQICSTISNTIKKILTNLFQPVDANTLKKILPDKIRFLRSFQNDIQCIRNDIIQNVENILKQMEMDPFQLILQKYGTKIKTFEQNLLKAHSAVQEQYGICFGESLQIKEHSQQQLQAWLNSLIFDRTPTDYIHSSPSNIKPIYISFENKEIFQNKSSNKENTERTHENWQINNNIQSEFILQQQRQSQTSKFVDLLNKINSNQSQKSNFLTSFLTPVSVCEQTYQQMTDHQLSRDDSIHKSSWREIPKSPQFKDID